MSKNKTDIITCELHKLPVDRDEHHVDELQKLWITFPQDAVDWLRLNTPITVQVKDLDFRVSLNAEGLMVAVSSQPSLYLSLPCCQGRTFATGWISADLSFYRSALLAINNSWRPPALSIVCTEPLQELELPPLLPPEKRVKGTLKPKKGYRRLPAAEPSRVVDLVNSLNRRFGHGVK